MKRLTETSMFRQLCMPETFDLSETTLTRMYDDFVREVIAICTSEQQS